MAGLKMGEGELVRTVIADGFHRAAFHSFLTQGFFLFILRLFVEIGIAAIIVPSEVLRSRLATQVTINALSVAVVFAWCVVFVFIFFSRHDKPIVLPKLSDFEVINQGDSSGSCIK